MNHFLIPIFIFMLCMYVFIKHVKFCFADFQIFVNDICCTFEIYHVNVQRLCRVHYHCSNPFHSNFPQFINLFLADSGHLFPVLGRANHTAVDIP